MQFTSAVTNPVHSATVISIVVKADSDARSRISSRILSSAAFMQTST
jgi:hypothetical protein